MKPVSCPPAGSGNLSCFIEGKLNFSGKPIQFSRARYVSLDDRIITGLGRSYRFLCKLALIAELPFIFYLAGFELSSVSREKNTAPYGTTFFVFQFFFFSRFAFVRFFRKY